MYNSTIDFIVSAWDQHHQLALNHRKNRSNKTDHLEIIQALDCCQFSVVKTIIACHDLVGKDF